MRKENKIREDILKYLYDLRVNAKNKPRSGLSNPRKLTNIGYTREEINHNFQYLVDEGMIKKEKISKTIYYIISNQGIEYLKIDKDNGVQGRSSTLEQQGKYLDLFKKFEAKVKRMTGIHADSEGINSLINGMKQKNRVLVEENDEIIRNLWALRNIFSHKDRGEYIANVNSRAFTELERLIGFLENPPKVIDEFKTNVYVCSLDDSTEKVIGKMKEKLYTHIPVYGEGNEFIGVFSEASIFLWLSENILKGNANFNKRKMSMFNKKYFHCENDKYDFIPEDTNMFEVQQRFEDHIKDGKRLGVLLITKNGKQNEKITGAITAWDLARVRKYIRI